MNVLKNKALYDRWKRLADEQQPLATAMSQGMATASRDTALRIGIDGFARMVSEVVLGNNFVVRAVIGDDLRNAVEKVIREPLLKAFNVGLANQMAGTNISAAGITPESYLPDDDAEEYAARVAMNYARTSADGMAELINRGVERGLDRDRLTEVALRGLGVDMRRAAAVDRYEANLTGTRSKRMRQTGAFARRQVRDRAQVFGDTETMTAMNLSQQALWQRAVNDGHLPPGTKKVWLTALDERVCPICKPMDNKRTPIPTMFTTSAGVVLVPPVHPRCRCVIIPDVLLGTRAEVTTRLAAA